MASNYSDIIKIRKKRTKILKEACGNKCVICNYNKIPQALEFHHFDETKKEFTLANNTLRKWIEIIKEVKKCILVCSNCHREIHYNIYTKKEIRKYYKQMIYNDDILNSCIDRNNIQKIEKICEICNNKFAAKRKNQKYCNPKCSQIGNRKIKNRPPKYILLKQLKNSNYSQLSKKYGVSDVTIKKWLK